MKYHHTFRVKAPQAAVAEFHSRSASMPAITPPPMIVRVHAAPARLASGDEMDFTLWAGPVPLRWVARIEDASECRLHRPAGARAVRAVGASPHLRARDR